MDLIPILYRLIPFAAVLVLGAYLFWLLRAHNLTVKYAAVWMLMLLVLLVFAIWPPVADWMAHSLGFELTSNFLFAVAIFVLIAVALHLSMQLVMLEEKLGDLSRALALATIESSRCAEEKPENETGKPHGSKDV